MHNARKENLMKNKKTLGILSLIFAAGLILGACNTKKSSETNPSSDESEATKEYTVTFVVDGKTVQTSQVKEGELASFDGATPEKAGDAENFKYGFRGWDNDIKTPITADTTFTAKFAPYVQEAMIGDFEDFASTAAMKEAGWCAIGWVDGGWSKDTKAAVSLGSRSEEGQKALRFDSWTNGVGYKIVKEFQPNEFPKAVNALKFRLMTPSVMTLKVLLQGEVTIAEEKMAAYFSYELKPISGEYVEYVIPFDAPEWKLWGEEGKSMVEVADYIGVHQDDVVNYLTSIEFLLTGSAANGASCVSFLDSARFVTLDSPKTSQTDTVAPFRTYTGKIASGNIVRIDINDQQGNATAKIIDLEVPQTIPGKVAADGNEISFTSADQGASLIYRGTMTNGGQLIKFKSAEGTLKNDIGEMNLDAVQTVENFDQYTSDGTSYHQGNTPEDRSGCRGAYYSEYYTGVETDSSPWGGSKWLLMGGAGDQLKLKQDQAGAHSGSNYVCMKNSSSKAMRYMQWGLFDGSSEKVSFRGSKLGFWAKTNGLVKKFHAYAFSKTNPTAQDLSNGVGHKKVTFEETAAVSEWKHYELDLNPEIVYYGYMITIEPNWASDSYLYIDDVEIYNASPYATYIPPKVPTIVPGLNYVGKINGLVATGLMFTNATDVTLAAPGLSMTLNGTYALVGDELTCTFENLTYVATLENNDKDLTFKSVTGSSPYAAYLNNLSFSMLEYADNAETYENDGKMYYQSNKDESQISGARGAYHCDYYSAGTSTPSIIGGSNWSLMGGSGDQLQLDKTTGADGNQSLKMKFSTAGNMRFIQWGLAKGTAEAHKGFNKFGVFFKNTNAYDVKAKILLYKIAKVEPGTQSGASYRDELEVTIPANSDWKLYSMDIDASKSYYGYGINMITKDKTGFLHVDFAHYYNDYDGPTNFLFAKEGLELSGNITAGQAKLTFGKDGAVQLTCAALGGDLSGTYQLQVNEGTQYMLIKTSMGNITGSYSIDLQGKVTFTVVAVTGDLAAGVNVGATLTNQ